MEALVVPGEPQTLESIVETVQAICRRQGATGYSIAKATGLQVAIDTASRFLHGYKKSGEAAQSRVNDPNQPGRCRLESFLRIIQALGYDVEIVARQALEMIPK
ncbi:MAG: hypothetical protein HY718_21655 [Planctomycetes bacterium]|nr:hypothetical protein [Planctomycetota bacterium]